MPPEVETVYCQYCRKALTVKEEIEQNFHNVCHLEISNYEDNKESQYWYYLDAINATFDDISCDKDGNIIAIDLSRKGMTYLPDINNIDIFSHLEELNLSLNYLTRVPDWLYELPKLKRIIFPGNGFSHSLMRDILQLNNHGKEVISTGCKFNQNNELKILNLSWLGSASVLNFSPEITEHFSPLESIILRNNNLRQLPSWIFELKQLKELNLLGNRLINIPRRKKLQAKNLRKLNLANNRMDRIPDWVVEQEHLVELDVANNPLLELSENILKMKKLKQITLSFSHVSKHVLYSDIPKLEQNGIKVKDSIYNSDWWWIGNE